MRIFFGLLGVVSSVLLGLYVGVYLLLVGGGITILQEIVHLFNGEFVSLFAIMIGVIMIAMSGFVGWLTFYIILIPSVVILGWSKK